MEEVRSLAEALARAAEGDHGIRFIAGDRDEVRLPYRELRREALALLGGLAAAGVARGDEVVLQIEEQRPFLTLFWACLLGGIVPVPLAVGAQRDPRPKLWNVWELLRRPWLAAPAALLPSLHAAAGEERPAIAPRLNLRSLAWEELAGAAPAAPVDLDPGDLAYVQFSSGSTGDPKGVELTHRNLVANTGDISRRILAYDVLLSWMPLTHDMGLIAAHLSGVFAGAEQCLMPTALFVRRPVLWLKKASEHGATLLYSPNFGLHYFLESFKPELAAGWDLSRLRICNGAEPISVGIARRFLATLAPWGLRDGSLVPSYGLAEACVGVTAAPFWEPLRAHRLDRRSLAMGCRVVPAADAEPAHAVELVDNGFPFPHSAVRIADERSRPLAEDHVGHIEIRGDNVTRGYYGDPEATRRAFSEDGWLRTGDLGFLRQGRLVVTGRAKDMVIAGGGNYYLHDLERVAEEVPGLAPGHVVACGLPRPEGGGEGLVFFLYWKGKSGDFVPLADRVRDHLLLRVGLAVEAVVPVRRIPKTTSGKVQRFKLAESYAAGDFEDELREVDAARRAVPGGAGVADVADVALLDERRLLALVRGEAERILGGEVQPDRPLGEQGLDSRRAVALAAALGRLGGVDLPVSLAFDHPSPREIARFLAGEIARARGLAAPAPPSGAAAVAAAAADEPIAILGFGCRFPGGASGAAGLWRVLRDGVDAVGEIPHERWDAGSLYDPDPDTAGRMVTREGAFLAGIDGFDNAFFAISAAEAESLDPQQRLLLEVSWEALEHAGLDAGKLQGSAAGVFLGLCGADYAGKQVRSGDLGRIDAYSLTGNAASTAAGRLSYVYGFEGPCLALDTACSSSLVAVHLAAQSLRSGESSLALAGGVNLILTPEVHVGFSRLRAMAPDGRCKTFDAAADGYGRGEGCGIVVLKRLSAARADGDRVLAVLAGSAVNQDGATNGLTAPSGPAQQKVIRQALERARVAPAEVRYVEAHGTGTPLGDPQEVGALAAVYGAGRRECGAAPLLVGSVKTNLGHTEAAAGVAGLLKVVLALAHEEIPPNLHFRNPSPHIPWAALPVEVPVAPVPWPRGDRRRLAAVSSFGFSGTNAHAVLAEAPAVEVDAASGDGEGEPRRRIHVLPVSARSREALAALLAAHRPLLEAAESDDALHDLCSTAAVRRTHHAWRAALVGGSRQELLAALARLETGERAAGGSLPAAAVDAAPGTVFLFPGQGSQWVGMGRDLLRREPVFRRSMEEAERALAAHVDWRLLAALEGGARGGETGEDPLGSIDRVQPALFAIQISLAALWRSWGVHPDVVVGHSMGEIAAAHVAGALSLDDAARVICRRSRLLLRASGRGAMAAVELSLDAAREALAGREERLSIAAANGPRSTVLSGDPAALDDLLAELEGRGVFARRIKVDVASHSHQMDPLAAELRHQLAGIAPRPAAIPLYSTVTGRMSDGRDLDAEYWVANLRQPVLFAPALAELLRREHRVFLEMSPHPILLSAVEQCIEDAGRAGKAHASGSLWRERPEAEELLGNLALLYTQGYPVDWRRLYSAPGRLVDLPPYPWQRRRFWIEDAPAGRRGSAADHPLLGRALEVADERVHYWENELDLRRLPYLEDHRVEEDALFPAAGWIAMATAASRRLHGTPWDLADVELVAALPLAPGAPRRVQLRIEDGPPAAFELSSALPAGADGEVGGWQLHARGSLRPRGPHEPAAGPIRPPSPDPRALRRSGAEHYAALARRGLRYGPRFQGVQEIWVGKGAALARVALEPPPPPAAAASAELHPALLDACLQAFGPAADEQAGGASASGPFLPVAIGRLELLGPPTAELWASATWRPSADGASLEGDLAVCGGPGGEPILRATGLRFARLGEGSAAAAGEAGGSLFELAWIPASLPAETAGSPQRAMQAAPCIVFAGGGAVSEAILGRLAARGGEAVRVGMGDAYARPSAASCEVDPESAADLERFFLDLPRGLPPGGLLARDLVYLWGIDPPDEPDPARVAADVLRLARLLQGLSRAELSIPLRLLLVTRGAVAVPGDDSPVLPGQAALWGLARTIAAEHPELACRRIDLSAASPEVEIDRLLDRLADGLGSAAELALRGESWTMPRLVPAEPARAGLEPARGRRYRAGIGRPGDLDGLVLRALRGPEIPSPGPGEVEVEVRATGLNFLNLMSALGSYPGAPGGFRSLGIECAGRVVRVGEGVDSLAAGDEVFGLATDCLASHAIARARLLAKKPAELSFAAAASLPVAYLTASHALGDLACLTAGESVLIHSAAGGVGLAAFELARRAGAVIYATAGSEEKRELLRSLGAERAMDSRSLAFADEVIAATGGRGVDVVLSSLAGAAQRRSLALLAPCGRFLEIGKRDLYGGGRLDLGLLRRGISYFAIDLDLLAAERPARLERLLDRLAGELAAGAVEPPPRKEFPLARMREAFELMASGRHVGKIVLVAPAADAATEARGGEDEPLLEAAAGLRVEAEASYLVTGGYGALGLACAEWLLARGAGHVALLGRHGGQRPRERSPEIEARLATMATLAASGRVSLLSADVADPAGLSFALDEIERSHPPLRGVLHAAGVLADGALVALDAESCRRVLAPKVDGAWNLHLLTAGRELDFFVLFSSAASLFGSPGQASYGAANAFLDGLASYRRRRGLAALAVHWGPVAGGGLAVEAERAGRLAGMGLESLAPADVPRLLEAALGLGAVEVAALHLAATRPDHPLLADLAAAAGGAPPAGAWRARLAALASPRERLERLEAHLVEQLAQVLRCPAASVGTDTPFKSLGLDSLSAIQLAKRLGASLELPVPVTSFWSHPTVEQHRDYLAQKLGLETAHTAASVPPCSDPPARSAPRETSVAAARAEVLGLSEAAAERRLRERLAAVSPTVSEGAQNEQAEIHEISLIPS